MNYGNRIKEEMKQKRKYKNKSSRLGQKIKIIMNN